MPASVFDLFQTVCIDSTASLEPFMKRKIVICMGSSCFARGNEENLRVIEDFLKSNNLQAEVLLSGRCCAGICSEGPNIIIDDTTYSHVSKEALIDILNREFIAK